MSKESNETLAQMEERVKLRNSELDMELQKGKEVLRLLDELKAIKFKSVK